MKQGQSYRPFPLSPSAANLLVCGRRLRREGLPESGSGLSPGRGKKHAPSVIAILTPLYIACGIISFVMESDHRKGPKNKKLLIRPTQRRIRASHTSGCSGRQNRVAEPTPILPGTGAKATAPEGAAGAALAPSFPRLEALQSAAPLQLLQAVKRLPAAASGAPVAGGIPKNGHAAGLSSVFC